MTDKLMSRRMASHYLGTSKRYLKALTQVGRMFPEKSFPERWSKQDLDRYKQEIGRDITPDLEASLIRSMKSR